MTVRSNDDDPVGGELLVVGQDPKSFECDVEVGLGGPACSRVLRQGAERRQVPCLDRHVLGQGCGKAGVAGNRAGIISLQSAV